MLPSLVSLAWVWHGWDKDWSIEVNARETLVSTRSLLSSSKTELSFSFLKRLLIARLFGTGRFTPFSGEDGFSILTSSDPFAARKDVDSSMSLTSSIPDSEDEEEFGDGEETGEGEGGQDKSESTGDCRGS